MVSTEIWLLIIQVEVERGFNSRLGFLPSSSVWTLDTSNVQSPLLQFYDDASFTIECRATGCLYIFSRLLLVPLPPLGHALVERTPINPISHEVHRYTAARKDQSQLHMRRVREATDREGHLPKLFDFLIPGFIVEEEHVGVCDTGLFVD